MSNTQFGAARPRGCVSTRTQPVLSALVWFFILRDRHTSDVSFLTDEDGQDVVEYGLLMASVAVVVLLGTIAFGNQVEPWFQLLAAHITTVGT
jgi:Flp pilus assembly pilin Flp